MIHITDDLIATTDHVIYRTDDGISSNPGCDNYRPGDFIYPGHTIKKSEDGDYNA